MRSVDAVAQKVIEYYAKYSTTAHEDILHTQEVVCYTRLIALGCDDRTELGLDMIECAAWLHDIGCPRSKEIYGNSRPENQQSVGRVVAKEILDEIECIDNNFKHWLVDVVGTHHQANKAEELEFQSLFEADLIVNILSGYYAREKAPQLYTKLMKSDSGKRLFERLIGEIEQEQTKQ